VEKRSRIVVIGATSLIAEHCARFWAENVSVDMTLVGRDIAKTERVALDLRVRSPKSNIRVVRADFVDPVAIQAVVNSICSLGPIDRILIAQGSLPEQVDCETNLEVCNAALQINGVSPVLFAEAFAQHLSRWGGGTLGLIGSVAGDRGRRSNYVYGASKGMVARYAEGLQHRFFNTAIKIILIKPGPTDTPMTAHLKQTNATLAPVEDVAKRIVCAMENGDRVCYAPSKWRYIMLVIRSLPMAIFGKLNV
jgi:decaprenylphospho-beta-D-erythro-pentofuranosid-2-ulose 2-reductase